MCHYYNAWILKCVKIKTGDPLLNVFICLNSGVLWWQFLIYNNLVFPRKTFLFLYSFSSPLVTVCFQLCPLVTFCLFSVFVHGACRSSADVSEHTLGYHGWYFTAETHRNVTSSATKWNCCNANKNNYRKT